MKIYLVLIFIILFSSFSPASLINQNTAEIIFGDVNQNKFIVRGDRDLVRRIECRFEGEYRIERDGIRLSHIQDMLGFIGGHEGKLIIYCQGGVSDINVEYIDNSSIPSNGMDIFIRSETSFGIRDIPMNSQIFSNSKNIISRYHKNISAQEYLNIMGIPFPSNLLEYLKQHIRSTQIILRAYGADEFVIKRILIGYL